MAMAIAPKLCAPMLALVTLLSSTSALGQMPRTLIPCSTASSTPSSLIVENNTSNAVDLYWINHQCKEQLIGPIQPKTFSSHQTSVTHPFRVRERASGRLLRQITITSPETRYLLVDERCSGSVGNPNTLTVVNTLAFSIDVKWRDYNCAEVFTRSLGPGQSFSQNTYVNHVWSVRRTSDGRLVQDFRIVRAGASVVKIGERNAADRTDDTSSYQIHPIYMLPLGATDKSLDRDGTIAASLTAAQTWLASQTGGRRLQLDQFEGALDISHVRLNKTDSEMTARAIQLGGKPFMREAIQEQLHAHGFNAPGKIYAIYYGGGSAIESCGGAPIPPSGAQGNAIALYLDGRPVNSMPCSQNPFASDLKAPGYWEFSSLHEVLHALGFAPVPGAAGIPAHCTPNRVFQGHVGDSTSDLMYAGPELWRPSVLDYGRNDYFGHNRTDCPDLMRSAFLFPALANSVPPLGWR